MGVFAATTVAMIAATVAATTAAAQDTTRTRRDTAATRRDTTGRDTSRARIDSIEAEDRRILERQRRLADSIKTPIAHAESPGLPGIGPGQAWDRNDLFASGALTLGELLDQVPGVTGFRTGWIGSPHLLAYLGQFGRVRVFYDGVELEALDARNGGLFDFSFLETWQLDDARVERAAGEVRVHLRSWRVRSTTPVTRVDVHTGDIETNTYRAFYGRRFTRGEVLQLGGYNLSTVDTRFGGDTDQTSVWGRLGWARREWSVDASFTRMTRDRVEQLREEPRANLPGLNGVSSMAFARVGYGDPDAGPWLQAMAATQKFTVRSPPLAVVDTTRMPDGTIESIDTTFVNTDSTMVHPQYVLAGGLTRGPVRLSATGRLRRVNGQTFMTPSVRAAFERSRLAVSTFVERSPWENLVRAELSGRFQPTSYLALAGAVSRYAPARAESASAWLAVRGEAGLRLGRVWFTGGMMTRDSTSQPAPVVFDTGFRAGADGRALGSFATIRGKFYRDIGLDVVGLRYGEAGAFRPQYQTRSRLYLDSDMRNRYPSGNLHILLAITHEYRSPALFPTSSGDTFSTQHYRTWGLLLEIRLLTATLTYQYRNFMDERYQQVPGFNMPRPINFYGIRWNFFN